MFPYVPQFRAGNAPPRQTPSAITAKRKKALSSIMLLCFFASLLLCVNSLWAGNDFNAEKQRSGELNRCYPAAGWGEASRRAAFCPLRQLDLDLEVAVDGFVDASSLDGLFKRKMGTTGARGTQGGSPRTSQFWVNTSVGCSPATISKLLVQHSGTATAVVCRMR